MIGESRYISLPKLANPEKDARSIAESLEKMGYRTSLLLDANGEAIRREIRKFATGSSRAAVAVVFYAGHGAQLNGSNYLLPTDVDVPRTEADIQFAGVKVDDFVNSIASNTKIVFLDACRDNPALFKNLVKGRGGAVNGLAPATASNFSQGKPGGGVFIAYATDAGAVADDGKGLHSPFTEALLRHMQKPISIDDMFSLVTREVRLVTKNTQRPYKYASLESIVCLSPGCSNTATAQTTDIFQQAARSEDEEFQIALQTKRAAALETFLQKYPDTGRRVEALDAIAELRRAEFSEWTLFEVAQLKYPYYIKLSSIRQFAKRAVADQRNVPDLSLPGFKQYPTAEFVEDVSTYDCESPRMVISEQKILDSMGQVIYQYKWGYPRYLNFEMGVKLETGTIGNTARNIACHQEIATPAVSKERLSKMDFTSLSSTFSGDGEMFYEPLPAQQSTQDEKRFLLVFKFFKEQEVPHPPASTFKNFPHYVVEVDRTALKCEEGKLSAVTSEFYDRANELVYLQAQDASALKWIEIKAIASPLSLLRRIFCGGGEAQK